MPAPVQQFGRGNSSREVSSQFINGSKTIAAASHVTAHIDCTCVHSSSHREEGGRGLVKVPHGGR